MTAANQEWDFTYSSSTKQFEPKGHLSTALDINRLGAKHRQQIREIALLEFKRLAQKYGIKYSTEIIELQDPGAKAFKGRKSVFGVELTTLMKKDNEIRPHCRIPLVAQMLLDCLDYHGYQIQGMMRLSVEESLLDEIKKLIAKDFYRNRKAIEKQLQENSVHLTANVLKFFIRSLPGTLFTKDYADAFAQLSEIDDLSDRLKAMKMLIFQLPDANAVLLHELLSRLQKIAANEKLSRMNVEALSRIFTTSLFEVQTHKLVTRENEALEDRPPFCLTTMLIRCNDMLFTVPPFMGHELFLQVGEIQSKQKDGAEKEKPSKRRRLAEKFCL